MFVVNLTDIDRVLKDFKIGSEIRDISELQRYHYERDDPDSKEVRLIVKVELKSGPPLVIRFKNEADVTLEGIEDQSRFADELRKNGITTPYQFRLEGAYARLYKINGYDVIVTAEQFAEHEVRVVEPVIAEKTGRLLAQMHSISEKNNLHVPNKVLFDPFAANDLFDFEAFASVESFLRGKEEVLFHRIVQKYHSYMELLEPLRSLPRYAVQGDISFCNLYQTPSGEIGVFDFNRCGDNNLFCDAFMQAVFEARLMNYPDGSKSGLKREIFDSFLKGYRSVRSFSAEEQAWCPYLYAVINGFWKIDMKWDKDSLINAAKRGDVEKVRQWLETIWQRLILPDRAFSSLI